MPVPIVPIAMNVLGSIGAAIAGRQKAPKQAEAPRVNVAEGQADAINANRANFGAAAALSRQSNEFAQGEAKRLLEQAIPGFGALQKQLLDSVASDMKNTGLDPEVQAQMQRFAAEKGITRGTRGGFNNFSLVKDFGFNLTDWNNAKRARALNTLSTVFGMSPRVNPTSPMAMFVDTNTAIGVRRDNAMAAYNVQQAGFNAQAAASNHNRSLWAGAFQNIAGMGTAMLGGGAGGGGGGGMGAPGGLGKPPGYSPTQAQRNVSRGTSVTFGPMRVMGYEDPTE